jgi:cytochrome bd ubiquinol oxidase subunit I
VELSLGFHIIFSAIGTALPVAMLIAEWRWVKYADDDARALRRTRSRLTAVTFAIGDVSGTALSFELAGAWPDRVRRAAGPASLAALWGGHFRSARVLGALQVITLLAGWAAA